MPKSLVSTTNSLELEILWTDDADRMVELAVRVSGLAHSAYHETYLYPEELEAFAAELKEFPRALDAEVVLECGAKAPNVQDYFRMRVFLLNPRGVSALEFESEIRGDPPSCAEVHFFIAGWPADFNRMGSELIRWLKNTTEPLRIEWTNADTR